MKNPLHDIFKLICRDDRGWDNISGATMQVCWVCCIQVPTFWSIWYFKHSPLPSYFHTRNWHKITVVNKHNTSTLRNFITVFFMRFSSHKCTKFEISRGSAQDSAGEAYSAPKDPVAGGEGARCPVPKNPSSVFSCRPFALSISNYPYFILWRPYGWDLNHVRVQTFILKASLSRPANRRTFDENTETAVTLARPTCHVTSHLYDVLSPARKPQLCAVESDAVWCRD